MSIKQGERQYQMTDNFAIYILKYLKDKNMSFAMFCELADLPDYITYKVISRKIKMHCYLSFLKKIGDFFGIDNMVLHVRQKYKYGNN
ncbi:MAG: hypothetical protein PHR96_05035 [Clostridia bacterium]|jgi:hypothetical protein|nr:hypothetical protein [Clostridia bacterium]MDD3397882.1 hypothetical protein [Clostridia bacterium]